MLAVSWREVALGQFPEFVPESQRANKGRLYNAYWVSYIDALRSLVDPSLSTWRDLAGVEVEWVRRKVAPVLAKKFGERRAARLVQLALGGKPYGPPPRWWIDNRKQTGDAGKEK